MKKLLAILLALTMLLSLVACASKPAETEEAAQPAAEEQPAEEPAEEAEEPAEEAPAEEAPAEEAAEEIVYEEGPLIVGSWGGSLDPVLEEVILPQFKELTGQEFILDPSYSSTKMISEGAGNTSVDVAIMGDSEVADLAAFDLVQDIDFSKIEMDEYFYDIAHDATGKGVFFNWGRYGICYRTDLCDTAPTSWKDLWDDTYAGSVAINRMSSTAGKQLLTMAADLNGGDQYNIDPGFEALGRLAETNLFAIAESTAMMGQMITSGDVKIAAWWDGRTYQLKDSGVSVDFVTPEEGAFACINEWVISKDCECPNLAYAFINLCLKPENQMEEVVATGYGPCDTVSAEMLPDELRESVIDTPEEVDTLIILDWSYISTQAAEWLERADKEIVAKIQQ